MVWLKCSQIANRLRDYMSKSCDRIRFFVINLLLYQSYRRLGKREKPFRAPYLKPIWYKVTGSLSSRITSLWYLDNFLDKTFFLTTETLCDKIFSMLYTTFHIRKLLKLDGVTQFTEQKSGFTCFLDLEL